jgi:aminomethyltransferase
MKQTALHRLHQQSNAKMAEFQGWHLPLQFSDPAEEYHAVRGAAGLFDVGHLGRIEISGPAAEALMQRIFTRNIVRLSENTLLYGLLCNESGFVLDDAVLFKLPAEKSGRRFLLTTNAANTEKILKWLRQNAAPGDLVREITSETAHLSLAGPRADAILEKMAGTLYKKIKQKHIKEIKLLEQPVLVSRAGYTGERGYEFIFPAAGAEALWNALLETGRELGLLACGMACRDVLRQEMGYVLYGNDIDESRTPLEAGLAAFVDFRKDFIGKEALQKRKAEGIREKLVGFELYDKGIPKPGGSIFSENREIGAVTSGCHSPHRRKDIGLGYVLARYAQPGQEIEIEVKDREIAAKIVELPFYRRK